MSIKTATFAFRFFGVLVFLILLASNLGVTPARATGECYVKAGAAGANNGASWTDAYPDLDSTLGASGCTEVWVAAGVYRPGTFVSPLDPRTATFQLKSGVALYGGFAGVTETLLSQRNPVVNVTILSGDIDNNDSQTPIITDLATVTGNTSNSYHVVTGATGAALDGFIVTAGYATDGWGGGMYNDASSPTVINVTFTGNAASGAYCGTCGGGGMFNIRSSPTLTNVTFSGNSAPRGGGLLNFNGNNPAFDSNPILTNVIFSNNSATVDSGGGMENGGGDPTLTNVTFSGNSAKCGGGLYNSTDSNPTLSDVTFSGNSATSDGGGMYNGGSPALTAVVFNNNSASGNDGSFFGGGGGGLYNYSTGSPTLTNVTFNGNSTSNYGGGLYNASSNLIMVSVTFSTNDAFVGGGMLNWSSSPTLSNITFISNTAEYGGGLSYYFSSNPMLTNVTFSDNSAIYDGGGLYNSSGSNPTLTGVSFSGNSAGGDGGGIYNGGELTVQNSTLSGNTADNRGGGLYNDEGTATVTASTLSGNRTTQTSFVNGSGGGGIYNAGTLTVQTSTLADNSAPFNTGGGIFNNGTLTVRASTLSGNSAGYTGGFWNQTGNTSLIQTIIANSSAGHDCGLASGGVTSVDSLIEGDACGLSSDYNTLLGVDPQLGPLADNGGSTRTFALLPGSPAIDAVKLWACLAADQRGQTRDDLGCDIGAYELKYADSHTVALTPGTALRTFGPTLIGVQVTAGDPGVITVTKSITWTTSPDNAILAKWAISPANLSGWTVNLKICWLPGELNGQAAANLSFWRYEGSTWTSFTPTSLDAVAGCAALEGVTGFSTWTLGVAQPNAVTLRDLTATANAPLSITGVLGAAFASLAMLSALLIRRRVQARVRP